MTRSYISRTPVRSPAVALCLLLLLFFAACRDHTPRLAPLAADSLILAFGDSLTAGTGAGREDSYPAVLETLTGFRIINAGKPGELSGEGLARLPDLLQRHQPALVILCHGGNDLLHRHDPAQTAANLRQIIELIQTSGAQILLLAVPKPGPWLRAAPVYPELANQYRIPYNGEILPAILSERTLKSDTIHPNSAGYRKLAETLAELIGRAD